ncbi:hypothetical protein FSP39_012568 [Pinctada imbricata]|uniref:Uncharacterized protein n=1 Tax=Pinctada imbricata TaxID=66713 RepID=A0AA88XZS6_PINIB|nr:hypothetical protein FSP39_012568 [Pinctada imbricata]
MAGRSKVDESSESEREELADRREATVPLLASKWTRQNLENVGIFYHRRTWSAKELISALKCRVTRRSSDQLPQICFAILHFMKEIWNFTLTTQTDADKIAEDRENIRKLLRDFPSKTHKFREEYQILLDDPQNFGIFSDWCSGIATFFKYLDVFLNRLRQGECCERTFESLFTKFTTACLLVPENGNAQKKSMMSIQGVYVSSVLDVIFPKLLESDATVDIVSMTEPQNFCTSGDDFDISEVPCGVLGRHGAELLIQTYRSYFSPVVSGMICSGTKDNAPVHKSVAAMAAIHDCGLTFIEHPPYSPDLAPSNFHLFSKLKAAISGTNFQSDDDVILAVDGFLTSQDKKFFKSGNEALKHRWQKCIDTEGDYVEK